MQELWYEVHYAECKVRKGDKQESLKKFRIRKRNPPPQSIFDGEKIKYNFKVKLVLCINYC